MKEQKLKFVKRLIDNALCITKTICQLPFPCSADTFVVNQTLVHRINICGKSPALRVAANR